MTASIVLGEDVGPDGGVFRVTDGLLDSSASSGSSTPRWPNRPSSACPSAWPSTGCGRCARSSSPASATTNFHQLENHAARLRWRSQGRLHRPHGAARALRRRRAGAGTPLREPGGLWAHTPGLKMVIPSGPRNARALLVSAIRDPDPVIFYEAKALYRAFREEVPEEEETMPIGKSQARPRWRRPDHDRLRRHAAA